MEKVLADAGHALVSAGAFTFDDDDDYLSGNSLDLHRLRIQVSEMCSWSKIGSFWT